MWRGYDEACRFIDNASRDEIIDYVGPDKYMAWNIQPIEGSGSVEFRRPPAVTGAKPAKHWIAFTMAFVEMAMQFCPDRFARYVRANPELHDLSFVDFETRLLACAQKLGICHT